MFTINGMGDVHQGFAGILLKHWGERTREPEEVLTELEPRISSIATAQAIAFSPPALPGSVGGPPFSSLSPRRATPASSPTCLPMSRSRRAKAAFIFSDSDLRFETPQIEFHIDHDKANRLGISMADIGGSLATLLGDQYVNLFDLYGRSYRVIPQVPRDFRLNEAGSRAANPHRIRHARPLVGMSRRSQERCSRTRLPTSSSSIRRRCRRCRSPDARSGRRSNS